MMNNKVSFTNSNNPTISLSAVIYFPPKFDETRQYPAIVVSHPGGGVKEQTAGTYAEKLAEKGFVTIAYDASYQGESGGEPRQLENPYIRTEDVSAVIDYLTTLSYVDNTRIGAMGICAGAGYTANAAIQDRRIKAIGTVSAVNIGSMFRNGWENNVKSIDALPYVDAGSDARTSDISSGEYATMPLAPMKESDAPNEELRQAWEYLFARQPAKIHKPYPTNSKIIMGDVLNHAALKQAMQGQDVVYANLTGEDLDIQANSVIAAMKACDVKRLIFVLSLGIYDEVPGKFGEWNNAVIGEPLKPFRRAADAIEASGLEYTILRPAWLTDEDIIDYELTSRNEPFKGTIVSRKSVAALITDIIDKPEKHIGENIGINQPGTDGDKPFFM